MNALMRHSAYLVRETLRDYFDPIRINFRSADSRASREVLRASVRGRDRNGHGSEIIAFIRAVICFNQGALIQFTYVSSQRHKSAKDQFRKVEKNLDDISDAVKGLLDFLNRDFYQVVYKNFDFLHDYFSISRNDLPRMCLKGNFSLSGNSGVVSIFRDSQVEYNSDSRIDTNTGFSEIARTGKYYLNNNLPRSSYLGGYCNPRLNTDKIAAIRSKYGESELGSFEISTKWHEYWCDQSQPRESFYKSTLIIPLTLWNNDLTGEFLEKINLENVDRMIFGYLCFDHPEVDYFDQNDISVGYIFADILSLYVFTRMTYTDASTTFKEIMSWMESDKEKVDVRSMLESVLEARFHESWGVDYFKDIKESYRNHLFEIDHILFDFARK